MIENMTTLADLMPLLPEIAVIGVAFGLLMLDLFLSEKQRVITHVLAVASLVAVAVMVIEPGFSERDICHGVNRCGNCG